MEDNDRDGRALPAEILQLILHLASTQQSKFEYCNLALVCRAWLNTVQTIAYSDITIRTASQFKAFYETINYNPQLGTNVRTLDMNFGTYGTKKAEKREMYQLLTNLLTTYVPNLEVLNREDIYSCIPTFYNLLDAQLNHVKRIPRPSIKEFKHYIKCAFLIKDRLESIYITRIAPLTFFGVRDKEKLNKQYQRLYDSLPQFTNLVEINITRERNEGIQVLEYIVEGCPSLESIELYLTPPDNNNRPTILSSNEISRYNPTANIKLLTVSITHSNDYTLLLYIMHKFRHLRGLILYFEENDPSFDLLTVSRLLDFVSPIDVFSITGLAVNQNNIMETIGNFYEKTAKLGSQNLYIDYCDDGRENMERSLRMRRDIRGGEVETTLAFSTDLDFEWILYMDFIKRCGKFIGTLHFGITLDDDPLGRSEVPADFFPNTLECCPDLRELRIDGCILKQIVCSEAKVKGRSSLEELHFQYCQIQSDILEQLSALLHEINQMILCKNVVYSPEYMLLDEGTNNEDTSDEGKVDNAQLMITLPNTHINSIIFQTDDSGGVIHIKVYAANDGKYYYYQLGVTPNNHIIASTEHQYAVKNHEEHVYVSCQEEPKLEIITLKYL